MIMKGVIYRSFGLVFCLLLLILPFHIQAAVPTCYKNLEKDFFRPALVTQGFSFHMTISQSTWSLISAEISKRAQDIPKMVAERARKMHPNPFDNTYRPELAEKVFVNVLMDVLTESLALYNITNQVTVSQIFDYLKLQHIKEWNACFKTE